MKLLILGNGFDLHHGLKTSFSNFRNHLLNSSNSSDNLLAANIDVLLSGQNINDTSDLLWNDYERLVGNLFNNGINVSVRGVNAYSTTEQFVERFYEYLIKENKNYKGTITNKIAEVFKDVDCILTFNYTDSYKTYLTPDKNIDVFHIHGQLAQGDLPIIGYFYPNANRKASIDYLERYQGLGFHKPALAFKQNEIDFENRILKFQQKWANHFSEIVSIGYSYGDSDSHIYQILNSIILPQINTKSVPQSRIDNVPTINFKLFKHTENELSRTVDKIRANFAQRHQRNSTLDITGGGRFTPGKKDIIIFDSIEYY